MSETTVNPQITDAVTQANVKVLADAPAMAMGSLYQTIGNSVSMAAANAVYAQQQANVVHQTATVQGIHTLLSGTQAAPPKAAADTEAVPDDQIDVLIGHLQHQIDELKAMKARKASKDSQGKEAENVKK